MISIFRSFPIRAASNRHLAIMPRGGNFADKIIVFLFKPAFYAMLNHGFAYRKPTISKCPNAYLDFLSSFDRKNNQLTFTRVVSFAATKNAFFSYLAWETTPPSSWLHLVPPFLLLQNGFSESYQAPILKLRAPNISQFNSSSRRHHIISLWNSGFGPSEWRGGDYGATIFNVVVRVFQLGKSESVSVAAKALILLISNK